MEVLNAKDFKQLIKAVEAWQSPIGQHEKEVFKRLKDPFHYNSDYPLIQTTPFGPEFTPNWWSFIINKGIGLPWWLNGKESACQGRGHGLDPRSGKIIHTSEQLSWCATTTEPVLQSPGAKTIEPMCHNDWRPCSLEPRLCNKRSHGNEKPKHHN